MRPRKPTPRPSTFDFQLEALPAPLLADGARLRQALIGLFNSAIHFAPENGTVEIRLKPIEKRHGGADGSRCRRRRRCRSAAVSLQPPAAAGSRQAVSPRAKYGRGLGLIRDIIDLHGGTIKAETDGETGVTFRVTLPLQAAPSAVHVEKVREIKRTLAGRGALAPGGHRAC